jgi:hypothetical protein
MVFLVLYPKRDFLFLPKTTIKEAHFMAIHSFTSSNQSMRKLIVRGSIFLALFGLSLSMTVAACGEEEEENAIAEEAEKVEKKDDSAKAKDDKKEQAEEARKALKTERDEKIRDLKDKRLNKAKVSAEARKKAINTAANAQSGRPEKSAVPAASIKGSATTGATRTVRPAAVVAPDVVPLNIDRILTVSDVKEVTGQKRLTSLGPLPGIQLSEHYNSRYMAPPKRSTFGSSVQIWKETLMRDMNERYSRMRRDYPNITDTNAITPKGFFSYWNDVMTLVFMDFQKKLLVAVSCSTEICTPEQLYKLAQRAKSQL